MYGDVRSSALVKGTAVKALPVTGAMMIGWNLVAGAVLLMVGLALLSITRVAMAHARKETLPLRVRNQRF